MHARAARNVFKTRPFITEEYRRKDMAMTLSRMVTERNIDVIHAHFLHMSQYHPFRGRAAFVHDAHNLEHVLWRRMAQTARNPLIRLFAKSQCPKRLHLHRRLGLRSENELSSTD